MSKARSIEAMEINHILRGIVSIGPKLPEPVAVNTQFSAAGSAPAIANPSPEARLINETLAGLNRSPV